MTATVLLSAPAIAQADGNTAALAQQVQALQQQLQSQQQQMQAQNQQMQVLLQQVQALQRQQLAAPPQSTAAAADAPASAARPSLTVYPPTAVAASAPPAVAPAAPAVTGNQAGGNLPPWVAASAPAGSKVKVTLGGFIESAGIYRTRNEVADVASNFNTGIPYPNIGANHEGEFRGSARQSRLSLLAQGAPDKNLALTGYIEGDFLGAAPTANSVESNSYTPRLRQAWTEIDRPESGNHFVAGQAWSLVTMESKGMLPRDENLPMVIDAQYVPGFTWTRNWQVRFVQDFDDKKVWAGISAESPQAIEFSGPNGPPGNTNFINTGGSGFASSVNYSTDLAPDLVAKLAFDPGWGHYEVYGVGRFFSDRSFGDNRTVFGGGGGAAAIVPLIDKELDLQLSGLAGAGIGRYGSSQLPDVAVKPDGSLSPVKEVEALAGLIAHPDPDWDAYVYGGFERAQRDSYVSAGGLGFGYGSSLYDNSGCETEGSLAATCVANTSQIVQLTAGTWWKAYQGGYGTLKAGIQNSYTKRYVFSGLGGSPETNDDITMVSLRYYPF